MKTLLLFCCFVAVYCQPILAQKNDPSDILYTENFVDFRQDQILLVIMQSEDPKIIKKLGNNPPAVEYYKNFIRQINETLLNAVRENWKINNIIEAKTLDEVIEIKKSPNASDYVVIGTVYQTTTVLLDEKSVTGTQTDQDYYYEIPISPQSIEYVVKNWKVKDEEERGFMDSILYFRSPDPAIRSYVACMQLDKSRITSGFNDKAGWTTLGWITQARQRVEQYEMNVYIKYIDQYITEAILDKTKTKEEFYTSHAPELENMKLVIVDSNFAKLSEMPKRLQDDLTSKSEFGQMYTYPFEIVTKAEWQRIVNEQPEGYACMMFTPLRGNSDLYIFNAETQEMIICTRPTYKTTNDFQFYYIRDQQVTYILNAINGVTTEQ